MLRLARQALLRSRTSLPLHSRTSRPTIGLGFPKTLSNASTTTCTRTIAREARIRLAATQTVRAMLSGSNVRVMPQSRESFSKALDRYEARGDKEYSL